MVLQGCLLGIHRSMVRSSVMSRKQLIFFEVQQFWLTTKLAQLKDNATWCNFSDQVLLFKNILVAPAGVSRSNHISSDQVLPLKNILVLPSGVSRSNHLINRNILVLLSGVSRSNLRANRAGGEIRYEQSCWSNGFNFYFLLANLDLI